MQNKKDPRISLDWPKSWNGTFLKLQIKAFTQKISLIPYLKFLLTLRMLTSQSEFKKYYLVAQYRKFHLILWLSNVHTKFSVWKKKSFLDLLLKDLFTEFKSKIWNVYFPLYIFGFLKSVFLKYVEIIDSYISKYILILEKLRLKTVCDYKHHLNKVYFVNW